LTQWIESADGQPAADVVGIGPAPIWSHPPRTPASAPGADEL
jgi:hypothetical protein